MDCLKDRVSRFYEQFAQQEEQIRTDMDRGNMEGAACRVREMLTETLGSLMFQLYKKDERYILECNTMLDSGKKILCFYFCDRLPEKLKKRWTFYYYHPAFRGNLTLGDRTFQAADFRMIPVVQDKAHKIDLQVISSEKFAGFGDKDRYVATYMMLIDHLGELAAEAYVGQISFLPKSFGWQKKEKSALTLDEFHIFLSRTIQSKGWVKPEEIRLIADSFQLKNKEKECRKDLISGISYSLDLLNEEEQPQEARAQTQYLGSCGVRYASLVLPRGGRAESECKKEKEAWEKKLSDRFAKNHSGTIVASAFGNTNCYLDFFTYDDETYRSICDTAKAELPSANVLDLADRSV